MTLVPLFILTLGIFNWGYTYPVVFLLIVFLRPKTKGYPIYLNFLLSVSFWLLLVTAVFYVAIGSRSISSMYQRIALPILAYAIGWTIAENESEKRTLDSLIALVGGYCTYASLNTFINIGNNRYMLVDFWSRSTRAATGSGAINTMTVSTLTYFGGIEKRRLIKILYLAFFMITVVYMFMLGTRTQFLILIITNMVGICILSYKKFGIVETIKNFLVLAIIIGLAVIAYNHNILSIREIISRTNLADRYANQRLINHSNSLRIQAFVSGVLELIKYPLGGRTDQLYRHNMWLDVARISWS